MNRTIRRPRSRSKVGAGAVVIALAITSSLPAAANTGDRAIVLDKGHIDGFEVTYDASAEQLELLLKDDTRIHEPGIVFRDPETVTMAFEDPRAVITLPSGGQWSFLGAHQGTEGWIGTQSGGDQTYVPWIGWSTERLTQSLSGTGISAASGQPVSLTVDVDGPGDVFTFMNDSFGAPINRFIDTTDPAPNVIPITSHAHVHTNWVFTDEGDYCLTVTPSLQTTGHGTITGPPVLYHIRIGDQPGAGCGGGGGGPVDPVDPGDPSTSQSIIAEVDAAAGALVISVDPQDRTVTLPTFQLASDGASWETGGELRPVTVTDTRAGAPGWTASGQVSEFRSDTATFSGGYLGWSPKVLDQASNQGVVPGSTVAPGFPSGPGLSTSSTLASTPAGSGTGTASLGADLQLRVPTDTPPGIYEAVLTFTAM